ncbi:MAG TPA: hypothetical protein VNI83_07495 [Vicinamibacterales bacterium]|nr:hypothetical protein [Vicinamibacterales bacterium]
MDPLWRDLAAGLVAAALLVFALLLGATLHLHRQRRRAEERAAAAAGRRIVAEVPAGSDLVLFCEDAERFYFGAASVAKADVRAVRLVVGGAAVSEEAVPGYQPRALPASVTARGEAVPGREHWDVVLETVSDALVVPCGALGERVSQEIACRIFERAKAAVAGTPAAQARGPGLE